MQRSARAWFTCLASKRSSWGKWTPTEVIWKWVAAEEPKCYQYLQLNAFQSLLYLTRLYNSPTLFCSGVPERHHLYSLFNSNVAFAVFVDLSLMLCASSSLESHQLDQRALKGRYTTNYYSLPFNSMHRRFLFNDFTFASETTLLLPEAAFQHGIGR